MATNSAHISPAAADNIAGELPAVPLLRQAPCVLVSCAEGGEIIAALLRAGYHHLKISCNGNQSAQPLRDRFKDCPNVYFSQTDAAREPNARPTLCQYGVINAGHGHPSEAINNALTYLSIEGFLLALVNSDYTHHGAETLQTMGDIKLIKIVRH